MRRSIEKKRVYLNINRDIQVQVLNRALNKCVKSITETPRLRIVYLVAILISGKIEIKPKLIESDM